MSTEASTGVARAVAIAGGQRALARKVGVQPQSVQFWLSAGRPPLERMLDVEAVTGVPWQELRPDLAQIFTAVRPAARRRARQGVASGA